MGRAEHRGHDRDRAVSDGDVRRLAPDRGGRPPSRSSPASSAAATTTTTARNDYFVRLARRHRRRGLRGPGRALAPALADDRHRFELLRGAARDRRHGGGDPGGRRPRRRAARAGLRRHLRDRRAARRPGRAARRRRARARRGADRGRACAPAARGRWRRSARAAAAGRTRRRGAPAPQRARRGGPRVPALAAGALAHQRARCARAGATSARSRCWRPRTPTARRPAAREAAGRPDRPRARQRRAVRRARGVAAPAHAPRWTRLAEAVTIQDERGSLVYANEAAAASLGFATPARAARHAAARDRRRVRLLPRGRLAAATSTGCPARQVLRGRTGGAACWCARSTARTGEERWRMVKATRRTGARGRAAAGGERDRGRHRGQARRARASASWPRRARCWPPRSTTSRR